MYISHFTYTSLVDEQLDWFHILDFMNNAAINIV